MAVPRRVAARPASLFCTVSDWLHNDSGPVLMLQGSANANTTLASARMAYPALQKGGNTQSTLKVFKGLGHTLSLTEQGWLVDCFRLMAEKLEDLVTWLNRRTQQR